MNALLIAAHVVAAVVWVGGMFFAYIVLRPTLAGVEPAVRLSLWAGVFGRFFPWVWLIISTLLVSGYVLIFSAFGGFATTPLSVHVMQLLGLVMMGLFIYLYFVPYPLFKAQVVAENWPAAAAALNRIRHVILVNLVFGLTVVAIAAGGRYT